MLTGKKKRYKRQQGKNCHRYKYYIGISFNSPTGCMPKFYIEVAYFIHKTNEEETSYKNKIRFEAEIRKRFWGGTLVPANFSATTRVVSQVIHSLNLLRNEISIHNNKPEISNEYITSIKTLKGEKNQSYLENLKL